AAGIVVITQISPIDVLFTLPQDRVPAVQSRLRAGAVLPVTALDRDGGATVAQGLFSTLDNQIDTTTGTVKAKARFANTDGALFPNQFVNARLLLDTVKGAVTIPATAVRNGPTGNFVFVVGPGSKAKLTPVTLGPTSGDNISITSGLAAGTVVVTEGADKLKDGGMVMLPGARGRGGPGAYGAGAGGAGADASGAVGGSGSGGHRHRHAAQPDG
ncbi:MAG: efflux RND transporter periplasmic adaptor subunit, partial [Janthinobacterium lividum]